MRYANGTTADVATVTNLVDVELVAGQLVIAGSDKEDHARYACVAKDLRVASCSAIASLTKAAEQRWIAARYGSMITGDLPDREQLADELATLGVKARADLLDVAAATAPETRLHRHVDRWAARVGLRYDFYSIIRAPVREARPYLDAIAAKLGDRPCTQIALTDAERAAITEWVHRQDAKPVQAEIAAAECGPYAWASWSRGDDPVRHEVLLARAGVKRLLGFTWDPTPDMPGGPTDFSHVESFFAHGDDIVGIAMHGDNVWVVSGAKVVAQSKGTTSLYDFTGDFAETSSDVFRDSGTLSHATPSGRDKLDPALVRDHEARRAALELVLDNAPSTERAYVVARELLGADAAIIAEAKALAATASP